MHKETAVEKKLRETASGLFPDEVECLVGYTQSDIAGRTNPVFIKEKAEAGKLIFDRFCINNLSVYPYYMKDEFMGSIGVVLKPCDVKSIAQLISEELLDKKKIKSVVVGCGGVIDIKRIQRNIGGGRIISAAQSGDSIEINTADKSYTLKMADFYAEKCYGCRIYDSPPYSDIFIENDEKLPVVPQNSNPDLLDILEKSELEEILAFWEKEFSRCIRCYACRNICPMEVCRDRCIAQLDLPRWQSGKINSDEGKFFQLIRVMHLAGRCTECGECQRVCPANIPLVTFMKKVNKEILRLFDYVPGMDSQARPPLLTFKNVEKNIKEEELF
ncbi:MAG: 4Fe-4S ferredoxin [Actinobacteria bacterium]|nr:4Fe-4S ferredoxin [Actinomycetota bacterium]